MQTHGPFMGVASLTWAIRKNLNVKTFKVTNPRKFSPSKISRYTVFAYNCVLN